MPGRDELIVRELLARHGRLYAEDAGIRLADRPGPLYQLLVLATLLSAPIPAETAVATGWDPDPDEQVNGLCLDPSATQLYAVGEFAMVGRAARDAAGRGRSG